MIIRWDQWREEAARAALFAAAYVVAMRLGLWTAPPGEKLALAWPAAGVALVWISRTRGTWPRALQWALLVALCAASNMAFAGTDAISSWLFGLVNGLQAVLAAAVILGQRWSSLGGGVKNARSAVVLVAASVVSGVGSALAGGVVAHVRFGEELGEGFGLIATRNTLSAFVVGAALLALPEVLRGLMAPGRPWRSMRFGRLPVYVIGLCATVAAFTVEHPVAFTVLPFVVWVAAVSGPAATAVFSMLQGAIVVWATTVGRGPFAVEGNPETAALLALALLTILTGTGLTLSIVAYDKEIAMESFQRERDKLRRYMHAAPVPSAHIAVTAAGRRVADHNQALVELVGEAELEYGLDFILWFAERDRASLEQAWDGLISASRTDGEAAPWRGQVQLRDDLGAVFVDISLGVTQQSGEGRRWSANVKLQMVDITAQRLAEERLRHAALHDGLTGLANRSRFEEVYGAAVTGGDAVPSVSGSGLALMYLDVDHFKSINDRYGHRAGDEVLRAIGSRLLQVIRDTDTAARLGGDEFVVLCPATGPSAAWSLARRLHADLSVPVLVGEDLIAVTVSVGLATFAPGQVPHVDRAMSAADTALYQAKRSGRSQVAHLRDGHDPLVSRAVPRSDEIVMHYQRITHPGARPGPVAVEALMRWRHPQLGLLRPAQFMGELVASPEMMRLGRVAVARAISDVARLRAPEGVRLHVNVSARELEADDFADFVAAALADAGLPPASLVLEITESEVLALTSRTLDQLAELQTLGVHVALDDFGTGYNGLHNLIDLPVDLLKLDRSFVDQIDTSATARAVAEAVYGLANSLGLDLVAEGVENEHQLAALTSIGYEDFQGFHWARPMPWEEMQVDITSCPSSMGRGELPG